MRLDKILNVLICGGENLVDEVGTSRRRYVLVGGFMMTWDMSIERRGVLASMGFSRMKLT